MVDALREEPALRLAGEEAAGLLLVERQGLCLTQVIARRGQLQAVAAALAMPLPERPSTTTALADGDALCLRPNDWLLVRHDPKGRRGGFALQLRAKLEGIAAVIDQSHGRVALGLEGEGARDALQKGLDLDMADSVFPDGAMAQAGLGGIAVTVLRRAAERFDVLAGRSFAADLAHHLMDKR